MINTMLTEILALLGASSLLGALVGWMIKSTLAKRKMRINNANWERKFSELELRSQQDTENLEDRMQSLGSELKTLTSNNRALSDSLRNNETNAHKARAEAIELNRQQAGTQEQLQRILQQKESEIVALKSDSLTAQQIRKAVVQTGAAATAAAQVTQLRANRLSSVEQTSGDVQKRLDSLNAKRDALKHQQQKLLNTADDNLQTMAIDQEDVPTDLFDETIRLDPSSLPGDGLGSLGDSTADATAILDDGIELNEATIALDEDALPISRSNKQAPTVRP